MQSGKGGRTGLRTRSGREERPAALWHQAPEGAGEGDELSVAGACLNSMTGIVV